MPSMPKHAPTIYRGETRPDLIISKNVFKYLHPYLSSHAATLSHPALLEHGSGRSLSYGEVVELSLRLAKGMRRTFWKSTIPANGRNRAPGSTALIISPNTLSVPILFLACLAAGVKMCPINPFSTPQEVSYFCGVGNADVIFAESCVGVVKEAMKMEGEEGQGWRKDRLWAIGDLLNGSEARGRDEREVYGRLDGLIGEDMLDLDDVIEDGEETFGVFWSSGTSVRLFVLRHNSLIELVFPGKTQRRPINTSQHVHNHFIHASRSGPLSTRG
jgi:acyl-CoA synthetase (AMP-forming)/AMP-acid ligase II